MKLVIAFVATIVATVAICQWFDSLHSFFFMSPSFTLFGGGAFIVLVLILVVWLAVSYVEDAYYNGVSRGAGIPPSPPPPIITTRLQNVDITSDPADPA